jgi:hypothetical protein
MENIFSVAITYKDIFGWIDYDAVAKKISIVLDSVEGKQAAEKFLTEEHEIRIPHETLLDFTTEIIHPLADIESFKTALTRLWENTQVHVDWSRPVEYVRQHRRLEDTKKYNEK